MIIETTYSPYDLVHGICESCGEESSEIDHTTGMCIDCIEEAKFIEESMKQYNKRPKWM